MEYFKKHYLKTTPVFDTYWKFACERQNIFIKKNNGEPSPWTNDPILQTYKFTNAYRASDRVSQYLIKDVIYSYSGNDEDLLFRILLFKIFNKIETWNYLLENIGEISYHTYKRSQYSSLLNDLREKKTAIYSGAYIMASGINEFGNRKKYENHLDLLELMFKDNLLLRINQCKSLEELYCLLLNYPTIGTFLAYQYTIDINYSEICDFDEMEFVVAGPGAKSGILKCFKDTDSLSESEVIRFMCENQEQEFNKRGLDFKYLFGRKLQLIDCQNLFCETDKYARVLHPEYIGTSSRKRIKQKYSTNKNAIEFFYPPKWGLTMR
ncbi:MAG: hypothetical protein IJI67_01625 [Clostridia bacterium]|nr:hypothetical protein [Clostridia bacterium]